MPLRLLLAIGFAMVAAAFARLPALAGIPMQGLVAYVALCGVGMLVVHRNLLAHVIGLLALGAGVTLAGAVLAPQLPESVELGATFDAIVGTFIGLALVRAFVSAESDARRRVLAEVARMNPLAFVVARAVRGIAPPARVSGRRRAPPREGLRSPRSRRSRRS